MLRLLSRIILSSVATILALLAANYFVPGFYISHEPKSLIITALIFTIVNGTLGSLLRFFFTPVIFLTLGIFYLVINASLLYFLDILRDDVTINGLLPLLYGTVIISFLNAIIHFAIKRVRKE